MHCLTGSRASVCIPIASLAPNRMPARARSSCLIRPDTFPSAHSASGIMGQPPQRTAWQLVLLVATAALAASAQGVGAVPTVPAPAAVDQSHDPAAAPPGMWLPFKEIGSMLQQRLAAAAEAIPRSADPQQAMQQSAANQAQAAPSTQSGLVAFNTGNPSNDWGLRSATGTPPQSPASFRARVGGYTPNGQGQ